MRERQDWLAGGLALGTQDGLQSGSGRGGGGGNLVGCIFDRLLGILFPRRKERERERSGADCRVCGPLECLSSLLGHVRRTPKIMFMITHKSNSRKMVHVSRIVIVKCGR